jgi:two-component system alkaline phosphatase synthesis response regulator PhoP
MPAVDQGTILVVDDHDDTRDLFRCFLERNGYRVLQAEDGLPVLDLTRRHQPNLIFLDISMPRLDGISVARQIRADPDTFLTPIVVLSAHTDRDTRASALDAGADVFLTKPCTPQALLSTAALVLGRAAGGRVTNAALPAIAG